MLMVKELIKRGDIGEIKDMMEKSEGQGMQTFDMALFNLHQEGRITLEDALKNADSANNLRLKIQLSHGTDKGAASDLTLQEEEEDDKGKGGFVE